MRAMAAIKAAAAKAGGRAAQPRGAAAPADAAAAGDGDASPQPRRDTPSKAMAKLFARGHTERLVEAIADVEGRNAGRPRRRWG